MWTVTHKELSNNVNIINAITQNTSVLKMVLFLIVNELNIFNKVFEAFAELLEGVPVVKLTTASNGGVYRMLELYEIVPNLISRLQAKIIFQLINNCQVRNNLFS